MMRSSNTALRQFSSVQIDTGHIQTATPRSATMKYPGSSSSSRSLYVIIDVIPPSQSCSSMCLPPNEPKSACMRATGDANKFLRSSTASKRLTGVLVGFLRGSEVRLEGRECIVAVEADARKIGDVSLPAHGGSELRGGRFQRRDGKRGGGLTPMRRRG